MNEYGERSIDGKLLGDHAHKGELTVAELVSGCVCCNLAAPLVRATFVAHLERVSGGRGCCSSAIREQIEAVHPFGHLAVEIYEARE